MSDPQSGQRRRLIVVSVAPTGPDPLHHLAAEIVAVDTGTGQRWHLAVPLTADDRAAADPDTLTAYGYTRRDVAAQAAREAHLFPARLTSLAAALAGHTLGGHFPELAATYLTTVLERWGLTALWHHRFADIGALTAGAWGIDPTHIPTLDLCCRLWEVPDPDLWTPAGEADAVAACVTALRARHGLPTRTADAADTPSESPPAPLADPLPCHPVRAAAGLWRLDQVGSAPHLVPVGDAR